MKIKCAIVLVLFVFAIFGCNNQYKYWDIEKFHMNEQALKDKEPIKLIYSSQGPNYGKNMDYYVQIIVVSQETGDTVNILSPINNGFKESDGDSTFIFVSKENIAFKLLQMDSEKINEIKDIEKIAEEPEKKITKVARDPEFDFIADNNYPTIIGMVGMDGN